MKSILITGINGFVGSNFTQKWSPLIYISIMSILLYTALVVFISVKSYFKSGVNPFYMIATFFLLHLSYGMGSLVGLVKVLFNRV